MTTPPPLLLDFGQSGAAPAVEFAGRWRRLFAFVLDSILLGVVASTMCAFFFEPLTHLGAWGRPVGCLIAVLYFGLMDGQPGEGQSLGKRLMRVRVVDAQGRTLAAGKSFLRAAVFCLPYFLNGIVLSSTQTPVAVTWLLSALVFGVGGATAYLLLFNGQTHQGLHDLAAGSYVTNAVEVESIERRGIWPRHWAILAALLVVFVMGGGLLTRWFSSLRPFPELLEDVRLVEQMPKVESAGVQSLTRFEGDVKTRTLVIRVITAGREEEEESLANSVAATVLEHDATAGKYDRLRVLVTRGYDLGIASSWQTERFEHAPAAWD